VALELYEKFHAAGLADDQLIIDPVVAPVIWENGVRHNQSVISIIRNLPDILGFPVKTIAGISNLTTGKIPLGKKQLLEQAFVPVLMSAGLSMALVDVFHQQTMKISRACHALLGKGVFSWAAL
jgi:5-methyltetrahydrofolate corrinoid/iron sulfur protein methyltransferase